MPMRGKQNGMTLIEALIALALLAIISGMAWRGLDAAIAAADVETRAMRNDERLRLALLIFGHDLVPLHGRLALAGAPPPLTSDGHHLLLHGDAGDTLYRLRDGRFERIRHLASGDSVDPHQALAKVTNLSELNELGFRFADDAGEWYERWPVGALPTLLLPAAIELTATATPGHAVRRLWLLRP